MHFNKPTKVYTAADNIKLFVIVDMLKSKGIEAHAEEDHSAANMSAFGIISQFHKPTIWVDESDELKAKEFIHQFEDNEKERNASQRDELDSKSDIHVTCEECGKETVFPASLNGTTQDCSHCLRYVDVGELPWEDDYGEPED